MFQNFSRAIALKFQSALTFRWQHVMWGELLGFLHPHPSVSRPCVLVCLCLILLPTTAPCIPSRHWLLFNHHSQIAGTYPGTKRLLQELEMLWLVHGQHDFTDFLTRRWDFFPPLFHRCLELGSCQEVVLMHSSCSGPAWCLLAHWSERQFDFGRQAQANTVWLHSYVSQISCHRSYLQILCCCIDSAVRESWTLICLLLLKRISQPSRYQVPHLQDGSII